MLRGLFKAVLVVFALLNTILAFHSWKFTHFYDDPALRKPQQQSFFSTLSFIVAGAKIPKRLNDSVPSLPHEIFTVTTSDGLHLKGWYLQGSNSTHSKPAVIMFHGHGSCRSAILPEAYQFLKQGHSVYLLDFRAHGNSEGEQCMVGINESADVKAAYEYATKKGEKQLVLWGASMGASTILKAIHDFNLHPAKLILEMPFATMKQATEGKLRIMHLPSSLSPFLVFWGGVLNGKWAFSYKPYNYADEVTCPVLLQWGRNDPRVTIDETNEIYAHLKTNKMLVIYENSAHESLYTKEPEKWVASVTDFLKN